MEKKAKSAKPRKKATDSAREQRRRERAEQDWKATFLLTLAATGNISAACRAAGKARQVVYRIKEQDEAFSQAWDEALTVIIDDLEESAMRRAKDGLERVKFHSRSGEPLIDPRTGEPYIEREYSDTLTITLLKAHRPERYRESTKVEMSGSVSAPITTPDELLASIASRLPGLAKALENQGSASED